MLPRLHLVTHDAVLARPEFGGLAEDIMAALGSRVALQLRAYHLDGVAQYRLAAELAPTALRTGSLLLINDRVDIAMAVRAGAHLRSTSLPVKDARRLLHHAPLGYSAHALEEASLAAAEGADYVFLGTIYESASHPDATPAGPDLIAAVAPGLGVPLLAIGGVTPERVPEVRGLGAHGVAVISGVWDAPDPLAAARAYLQALGEAETAGKAEH